MHCRHILIAHHSELVGRGIRKLLEEHGYDVVGLATGSDEAFALMAEHPGGILLLDGDLSGNGDGHFVIRDLAEDPRQLTMVLNTTSDVGHIAAALAAGAVSVLDNACAPDHLFAAIDIVSDGGMVFSDCSSQNLAEHMREAFALVSNRKTRVIDLTEREIDVLQLLPTPLTLKQIAARLYVSRKTIQNNASSLYRKLDAGSRAEAVARAIDLGLLSPRPGTHDPKTPYLGACAGL